MSKVKTNQHPLPNKIMGDVMEMRAEQLLKEKRHAVIALAAKHGAKNFRRFTP
jgi:hypothetical protein